MYFNIELEQFKRYRFLKSYGICDGENREWRMTMKLNSKNMIATHIQLIRGAGTECRFFIELEHMNLQKSIRKSSICKKFDFGNGTKPMWGFKFIEFDELKADAGFLRNDLLHFRFGVRPLLSTTGLAASYLTRMDIKYSIPLSYSSVRRQSYFNKVCNDICRTERASYFMEIPQRS